MNSNWPLVEYFYKLRFNPKWIIKIIILILLSVIIVLLTQYLTDQTHLLKQMGMNKDQINKQQSFNIETIISSSIGKIISSILVPFAIFLIVSRIMKSDVQKKSIFSASLSYSIIIETVSLVILIIQSIFNLNIPEYNISSLNIFQPGNQYLSAIDLKTFISSYIIGVVYFSTSNLSKKASIIWAIVTFIILISLGMMGAFFNNTVTHMTN